MKNQPSLKRLAARNFLLYGLDMAAAICGWVYGFGLHVSNWFVLIMVCLFVRWAFNLISSAWLYREARERLEAEREVSLRDHLASQALVAIIKADGTYNYQHRAAEAYQAADAMLKARVAS